jgi:hypothetical protein
MDRKLKHAFTWPANDLWSKFTRHPEISADPTFMSFQVDTSLIDDTAHGEFSQYGAVLFLTYYF